MAAGEIKYLIKMIHDSRDIHFPEAYAEMDKMAEEMKRGMK